MNIQEMAKTMEEMEMEMAKAQLADEVMEDALEDPEDETEIDTELQKVYEEVALDASMMMMRAGPGVPAGAGPARGPDEHPAARRLRSRQRPDGHAAPGPGVLSGAGSGAGRGSAAG